MSLDDEVTASVFSSYRVTCGSSGCRKPLQDNEVIVFFNLRGGGIAYTHVDCETKYCAEMLDILETTKRKLLYRSFVK